MRIGPIITLAVGVALASGAVFLVKQQLDNGHTETPVATQPQFPVKRLVVAASDLKFGNRVAREHVKEVLWPADSLPQDGFKSIEELLGNGGKERVVLRPMGRGEPILQAKVSGFGGRASMSTLIPHDKLAYAIRVNAVSGVAGFLLPGDRVDVLLTRRAGKGNGSSVTDVILQNVAVRGIDQVADEDRNKPLVARTVTVEATTEEAQKLALAMQVGTLTLAFRNTNSAEKAKVKTISVADLRGRKDRKATADAPKGPVVRVRRGVDLSLVKGRGQ